MKASLKFREDRQPLLRAKVPVSILGLPFLSGLAAALDDVRHLRLDLSTAFASGPSLRLSYRPNDPAAPFSLALKTGLGPLGSPAMGTPFSMAAEFGLLARPGSAGPSFSILFKPRFGDFAVKKTVSSTAASAAAAAKFDPLGGTEGDGLVNGAETPIVGFGGENRFLANGFGDGIHGLVSGFEVSTTSVLPLRSHTAVKFKWGLRATPELRTAFHDPAAGISFAKLPLLVMSKISIEHGANGRDAPATEKKGSDGELLEERSSMRRQLEALQAENGTLRRAVEELRAEVGGWKAASPAASGEDDSKGRSNFAAPAGKRARRGDEKAPEHPAKAAPEDVKKELKKALVMGSTGGGI
ncbi:uncharacterized protein LOC103997713 [Musa acuminata AAA Group]|uniref:uncharacterized protein LOC103997713 n=1 Tax=Musa acuminata AAA Group TaxID=214697 RepID=UPI0031D3EC3B